MKHWKGILMNKVLVDTDFIIAYIRENDRLHERAVELFNEYDDLYASPYVFLELGLVLTGWSDNVKSVMANVMEIVEPIGDEEVILRAGYYMDEYGLTAFDAFHCAHANDQKIISSDKGFDRTSVNRIDL